VIRLRVVDAARIVVERSLRVESRAGELLLERPLRQGDEKSTLVDMAREAGLKRPGSSPFATQAATVLLHCIRQSIDGRSVILCACSSTGPASVAVVFETAGMSGGWSTADPFWLQNTLPSFSASAIVNALSLRGRALGFPGDFPGIYGGLFHSAVALAAGRVERAVVVLAEDGLEFLSGLHEAAPSTWKGGLALVLEMPNAIRCPDLLEISVHRSAHRPRTGSASGYRLLNDVYDAMRAGVTYDRQYADGTGVTYSTRFGSPA
jgi:hypothetical protein